MNISRDLHDNIGAQLSFIVSSIGMVKYYNNDHNVHLTSRLDRIGTFAKEAIQELRDTIWAMNKDFISMRDLQSRIANYIEKKMYTVPKRLVFIIGGPYGFSKSVYNIANEKISLSEMTFTHQMVRLIFTEQLYRAMTIINNEPYHHE